MKKNYYSPSKSAKDMFYSVKWKFLRKYPNAKIFRKDGEIFVNGNYALYIGSAIGQSTEYKDIFKKLEKAYKK